jgi:NitT/TauT family transport system substrate-binding protein
MKLRSLMGLLVVLLAGCGGAAAPASSAPAAVASVAKPAASAAAGSVPAAKPAASSSVKPAASAAASSGQATNITVALSSLSATNIPSWVGQDAGIYQKNGLNADFKVIPGGSVTTSALLGGDVQIVMGGGSEALGAAVGGADLVIVGITTPTYTFIIEGPPSAKTLADLKGKTFGVPAARGTVDVATRVALKSQGIDPDKDVKITALGSVQAVSAALISHAIDAAAVNVPDNLSAEANGLHPVFNTAAAKLPAASNSIYVTRPYIASHRDVVQRYVDSVVQSIARIGTDKPLAVAAIKKNLKVDDTAANATYEFFKSGVFPALPYPKVDYFDDAKQTVGEQNPKVLSFDISKILDPSFVQSAADRGLDKA